MVLTSSMLQLPCHVYCSRFSPIMAEQLVGLGGDDGAAYVYPFGGYTRTARLEGDSSPLTALAFDPQQKHVAGGSDSGGVRFWDVATERLIRSFGAGHKSTVTGVDYHRYTDYIATCSRDKSLRIWDTRKKACLQSYKGASAALCATQFSPSGRWAASGCAEGIIRLYDLVSGKQLNEFKAHTGAITSISFHPELYYMAVSSSDGAVSLWEVENFTRVFQSNPLDTPVDVVHLFGNKMLVAADRILRSYDFNLMSDNNASDVEAPWHIVGDITYSSVSDEAWFVEFSRSTATMGRLPLARGKESFSAPRADISAQSSNPSLPGSKLGKAQGPVVSQQEENLRRIQKQIPKEHITHDSSATTVENPTVMDLLHSSATVLSVMRQRLTHIRVTRSLWMRDPQQAIEYIRQLCDDNADCGVVVDFLVVMQNMRMKERVTISALPTLLEVLKFALKGKHDCLTLAALKVFRSMNNKFRAKMEESRKFANSFRAVNSGAPEAMMQQYHELAKKFEGVAFLVHKLHERKDSIGEEAREVIAELPTFS